MAQPLAQKNKCLEHNLLKRSMGLPYEFTWKEDKFTPPLHPKPCELPLEKPDTLVPCFGVPERWNINVTHCSVPCPRITKGLPKSVQNKLDSALVIDAPKEGAVDDAKEYDLKESKTDVCAARLSSLSFNTKSTKPVMPVYQPCFPKMIKNQVLRPINLHCPLMIDKVFCSEWITDDEVIFGTKCHKLMCYNVKMDSFIKLRGPTFSGGTPSTLGIRCTKRNQSGTLLATVDSTGCKVALYLLPNMEPFLCVTESLDNNRIFDMCWLSNCKLAVARREGVITIWNFQSLFVSQSLQEPSPSISLCINQSQDSSLKTSSSEQKEELVNHVESTFEVSPASFHEVSFCIRDRVRALAFNGKETLFVLNSGASVCSFNTATCQSNWSMQIPGGLDNTCMAYSESLKLLTIGSSASVLFLEDNGGFPHLSQVELPTADSIYIRSLAFQDQTLSVGTGAGQLFFIDLSQFWSGKLSYYRTRYILPTSKDEDTHKLEGYVDIKREFFSFSRSLKADIIDYKFDKFSSNQFSRIQTFDKPLPKTFFEVVQSLYESGHSKDMKKDVEQYYENLDKLCDEDTDCKYLDEYCRRELTQFEVKMLMSSQEHRGDFVPEDSLAVYAQSYNPNTGLLFVAGGPLSVSNVGSFCSLLR